MQPSKLLLSALSLVFGIGLAAGLAQPQMPGAGPTGWNAAMTKLFGDVKAFTAKADMRVLDQADKETVSMVMGFALLEGKARMEIDMAQMKSALIPQGAAAQMKQMGMDRITMIALPEKKAMYLIYPGLQAYVDMPMPEEEAAAANKDFKVDKTAVGEETIDGHACVKSNVTLTDDKGKKFEAVVWEATDLKNFPVQTQMKDKENNIIMRYRDIQFAAPDAKQFDAPTGYTKYTDIQQLMQVVMQRMLGGAPPKQ